MSSLSQTIGQRLKLARKTAGFRSASGFAHHNNIPVSTYSQHETGKRILNADLLLQYATLLNISPAWLLTGNDAFKSRGQDTLISKELPPIEDALAWVNMDLSSEILIKLVPVLASDRNTTYRHLIDLSIETYNNIVAISTDQQNQLSMIDLSVTALKHGVSSLAPQE